MQFLKIIAMTSLLGLAGMLYGQEDEEPRHIWKGGLMLGYASLNTSGLEAFVPGGNDFGQDFYILGFRNQRQFDRFVFNYDFFGALGARAAHDSLRVSANAGFFTFGAGYVAAERKHWQFYPMVNAGLAITGVEITEEGDRSLPQVVQDPGREINLYRLGFVLDFSLNFEVTPSWKWSEEREEYSSFVAGLSLGYLLDLANDKWRYTGGRITGAPAYGMEGFYLRLTLAGASANRLVGGSD